MTKFSKQSETQDAKIYRAYIIAKEKGIPIGTIANSFEISRSALYDAVTRVKNGNIVKIRQCIEKSRNECLWTHKYKARVESLPKKHNIGTRDELKEIINDMLADGFVELEIAKRVNRDRGLVRKYLGK